MSLEVDIRHRLGAFTLDVRFEAGPGLTALFGRSGSGKTSTLHIVGGLVRPAAGRVVVDGAVLVDTASGVFVPPHRRRIGYVFQEGRLFPHLTVRQNLLYGRRLAPTPLRRADPHPRLDDVVGLLGIGALLHRRPANLSGGEKQRVAIGRALLSLPRLLLMDEPLASLDAERREEILPFIERLRDEAGIPILYVSHAIAEVARLATTLVLMAGGRVEAAGPVEEVMTRPAPLAEEADPEAGAVLPGTVAGHDPATQLTTLATPAGDLLVPHLEVAPGAAVRVRIRARDVLLATRPPEGLSALNVLPAVVLAVATGEGPAAEVRLRVGEATLVARITRRSVARLGIVPGRHVHAVVKSIAFDAPSVGRSWRPADAGMVVDL